MTPDKLLLITRDGWYSLADGYLSQIPAWSKVDGSVLLVTDFDEAPVGVLRFEGKPAYAAAMVEKHVRDEGLTDGATHIVLHRTVSVPDGCLALYTAVPLELWQRLQQWTRQQTDHCLLVTMASLLVAGLKPGEARVLRAGNLLHLVGFGDAGVFYASAVGYGSEDFQGATRILAAQSRVELGRDIKGPVQWACALGGDMATENTYAEAFAAATGIACVILTHAPLITGRKAQVVSALPALCARLTFRSIEGPLLARLAWLSEGAIAPLAGATAIVGLALLGLGMLVQNQSGVEDRLGKQLLGQVGVLEGRIAAANLVDAPASFAPVAEFARQLGDGATYDPVAMLKLMRQAAGNTIRIQRIKLESGANANTKRTYRIDGVSEKGGLDAVKNLLAQTQRAGWRADPLEPAEQAAGAFSYRLTAFASSPAP